MVFAAATELAAYYQTDLGGEPVIGTSGSPEALLTSPILPPPGGGRSARKRSTTAAESDFDLGGR